MIKIDTFFDCCLVLVGLIIYGLAFRNFIRGDYLFMTIELLLGSADIFIGISQIKKKNYMMRWE